MRSRGRAVSRGARYGSHSVSARSGATPTRQRRRARTSSSRTPRSEPHLRPKLAHEELYFVAAGRASFTIDGETHDAPAGTYVFVPDPASERHAVASEANTTVLSFGGPPTFEPSAWEWAFLATPLIGKDPKRAREILEEGLRVHPEAGGLYYNLACVEAVDGSRDEALTALRAAIERRPQAAEWAREDEDFESLRDDPEFRALAGL